VVRFSRERYTGKVWCVTVATGAFVARRRGQVFVTGNSGFPKSLDVSKAIDAAAGAERDVPRSVTGDGRGFDPMGALVGGSATSRCVVCRRTRGGQAGNCQCDTQGTPVTDDAKTWQGWGTALKPCLEPWALLRKPLGGRTVAANVLEWGTGGLNVDGCRYAYGDRAWPGPQSDHSSEWNREWSQAAYHPTAPAGKSDRSGASAPSAGRWPANVYVCPKPSTAEREIGCGHLAQASAAELVDRKAGSAGMDNPRAGAGRTSNGRGNVHPTVKPIALMQWLCRLVTQPGGTVLDPFAGSGTTGIAAMREGFGFVGIEMDAAHCEIARCRIRGDAPLLNTMREDHGAALPW
jgi:hypothetical protein